MVECEVHVLCGTACRFPVELDWTVATLKEKIDEELSYPCYAQVLSDANRILLNAEKLRDIYPGQDVIRSRISIFLAFIEVPSQLGQAQVQRAWEAFRLHSTDYGDTIPGTSFVRVLQYAGIGIPDSAVEDMRVDCKHMSFVNVLSFLAARDHTLDSNLTEELVAKVCCFSELAGARKPKDHSDDATVTRMREHIRSREARRKSVKLLYPPRRARSGRVSSNGPQNDETPASSRLLESSAAKERTVSLALMRL
eukprot:TRINITY_DN4476_c0_g2_i2.p1 TRINITY_DN4476_c0_g2~~TRINITY_DN4476_c0_g2_i2.p1  ORF type:complete len:253 (-),score=14.62 TRINITY_DN4476_c0_g2_i2:239-997(-)